MLSMINIMKSIMNAMENSCILHELQVNESNKFSIEFNTEYGSFTFREDDIYIVLSFKNNNCHYTLAKFCFTEFASIPNEKELEKIGSFKKIFIKELIHNLEIQFRRNVG